MKPLPIEFEPNASFCYRLARYHLLPEPEQTPKQYGCRTWRQALQQSQMFDLRKDKPGDGHGTQVWYRSKPGAVVE